MSDNTKEFGSFYCGDDDNWQVSDADAEYEIDEEMQGTDLVDEGNAQVTVPNKDGQISGLHLDADMARSGASDDKATEASNGEKDNKVPFDDDEDSMDLWDVETNQYVKLVEEIVIACKGIIKEISDEEGEVSDEDDIGGEIEEDEKDEVADE